MAQLEGGVGRVAAVHLSQTGDAGRDRERDIGVARTPRAILALAGQAISRAEAQQRMFAKLANPRFLLDMRPLLPAAQVEILTEASTAESFRLVFTALVDRLPGEPWAKTPAMKERFGILW